LVTVCGISDFQLVHFDTKESLLREVIKSSSIMRKFEPEEIDMIKKNVDKLNCVCVYPTDVDKLAST